MTKTLRIHHSAEDELAEAASWYESRQSGLGTALLDLTKKAMAGIQSGALPTSPVLSVKSELGARRILLPRYPYSIVLYDREDEIVIVAFAHNSRRPGYWRSREA